MDELIQAMSIPELETFKETYKTNESIVKVVDGYIEVKTREEEQAKAKDDFTKAIGKLVAKLVHPDDIHNIYMVWKASQVDEGEPEIVELKDKDGNPYNEERYPENLVEGWQVEVNKGFNVGKVGNTTATTTASKRAVTVSKRESPTSGTLVLVGHYPTASKAVEHLGLILGGDSATRVLQREGMFLEPYDGTDYTA